MDEVWIKLVIQLGSTGILAYVMYLFAKRFMDQNVTQMAETVKQMSLRIESSERRTDATEKRLDHCEADRAQLHKEFAEVLLKFTTHQ